MVNHGFMTMVNHGQSMVLIMLDYAWPDALEKWHHSWPWSNHGYSDHAFEKWHHGWPWSSHGWPRFEKWHHGQPWLTMVTVTMVDRALRNGTTVNHGWPWSPWPWLTMLWEMAPRSLWPWSWWPWLTMVKPWVSDRGAISQSAVNHGWTMVKSHGLTMVNHGWTMVNHGWTMFFSLRF